MGKHKFKSFLKKRRWTDDLARQFVDDAELAWKIHEELAGADQTVEIV
jgi:hypothetical protein